MYCNLGCGILALVIVCLILHQWLDYSPLYWAVIQFPISGELNEIHQVERKIEKKTKQNLMKPKNFLKKNISSQQDVSLLSHRKTNSNVKFKILFGTYRLRVSHINVPINNWISWRVYKKRTNKEKEWNKLFYIKVKFVNRCNLKNSEFSYFSGNNVFFKVKF